MKKLLPALIGLFSLLSGFMLDAQTFTVPYDTVIVPPFSNSAAPTDNITNITGNNLTIRWHVIATDFPADWLTASAFGICDAQTCRDNGTNGLWNLSTTSGSFYNATYYANAAHDSTMLFDLTLNLMTSTNPGTHYVTINLTDMGTGNYSKNITFLITKIPTSVPSVPTGVSEVVLYPNPAHDELNVVFDANSDVKNIAIYNIIGKVMAVYKVSGSSANLNMENIPSGIYFVRLYNSNGNILSTKKFTKQ